MAKPSLHLVEKLRETAVKLESGASYSWGHVSRCNCGHLAQSLLPLTSNDIYQAARSCGIDEWTEFANDYCPESGRLMDDIMDSLFGLGLEIDDIHQLEYLSNRKVLEALPGGFRYLEKGNRAHAALYMRTWASLLELECRQAAVVRAASPALMPA